MTHPFFKFPLHLFHKTKPPIVAENAEQEAKARADGYSEEYHRQEYPKQVVVERDSQGFPTKQILVNDAEEEKAITGGAE